MTAAIETFGLTKTFGHTRAVAGLDLRVGTGEVFGFLGPNGAGKTTTIRMLLALHRPTGGRATVLGLEPAADIAAATFDLALAHKLVAGRTPVVTNDFRLEGREDSGHEFPLDHGITGAQMIDARTLVAGETFDAYINAAAGATGATGDYEYNIGRDPIVRSGDWGLLRVLTPPGTTFAPTTSSTTLQRL